MTTHIIGADGRPLCKLIRLVTDEPVDDSVYVTPHPEDSNCKVCRIAFFREQRSVWDDLRAMLERREQKERDEERALRKKRLDDAGYEPPQPPLPGAA